MTLKVATPFFLTKWIAAIYSWVTYQRTASLWKQSKLPRNKVTHCVEPIPDVSTDWGFTTVFMCMHAQVLHFNLHRQVRTHNVPSHTHTHTHTQHLQQCTQGPTSLYFQVPYPYLVLLSWIHLNSNWRLVNNHVGHPWLRVIMTSYKASTLVHIHLEHDRLILTQQQTWQSRIETECYSVTYIIMFETLYN